MTHPWRSVRPPGFPAPSILSREAIDALGPQDNQFLDAVAHEASYDCGHALPHDDLSQLDGDPE